MLTFLIWLALILDAPSDNNVLVVNNTDMLFARIEIDDKKLERGAGGLSGPSKILIKVTPEKHHLRIVFVGGGTVDWPEFNFAGVREITFERAGNKIEARVE